MTVRQICDTARVTVVAVVTRNGMVECQHHGSVAVLDRDGQVVVRVGEPDLAMMPRSSVKPLQLLGMLRCGLQLPPPLIAVAMSSHAGEPMHTSRVEQILAAAGLDAGALQCPADQPGDPETALSRQCAGLGPAALYMNCSGKHAAMLATCVVNGWPTDTYLQPDHPLQRAISATFEDLAGEPIDGIAVDGCGAPILRISLAGLARAFHRMVAAPQASEERSIVDAALAHPLLVAGTARPDGQLAQSLPTLFAKAGAEAVFAGALPDGRAVAVRTHDGARRATQVVVADVLHRWGLRSDVLETQRRGVVLGGGRPAGAVTPVEGLLAALDA